MTIPLQTVGLAHWVGYNHFCSNVSAQTDEFRMEQKIFFIRAFAYLTLGTMRKKLRYHDKADRKHSLRANNIEIAEKEMHSVCLKGSYANNNEHMKIRPKRSRR